MKFNTLHFFVLKCHTIVIAEASCVKLPDRPMTSETCAAVLSSVRIFLRSYGVFVYVKTKIYLYSSCSMYINIKIKSLKFGKKIVYYFICKLQSTSS